MKLVVNNDVPKRDSAQPERRASRRRRTLKGAVLTFSNGCGAFEGVVRDQSESGASLGFGDATGVPPAFNVAIWGDERKRPVRVRWRSETAVGIEFV